MEDRPALGLGGSAPRTSPVEDRPVLGLGGSGPRTSGGRAPILGLLKEMFPEIHIKIPADTELIILMNVQADIDFY